MSIKNTVTQGLKREFEVTLPAAEIDAELVKYLEKIGKTAKVPGFRPGKIPFSILKQRYYDSALREVIEISIDKAIKKLVKDENLKAAGQPTVSLKSYEEGKDAVLHVALELLPEIGEIDLKGLAIDKYVVKIPGPEVKTALEEIAKRSREKHPLKTPRKSKKGDVVIIDFKGFIESKAFEGGEGKEYPLELGSNSFIPGFEDQLVGHDKGAKIDVNVTFPKDYHDARYAGKPAHFEVTLRDIEELEPATVDEAFAKRLGFQSLKELEEKVEANLSESYSRQSLLNTKRQVFDALTERFTFEVPQGMVESEFNNIWHQLLHEMDIDHSCADNQQGGKTFEEAVGRPEAEVRKDYESIAERRVRLGLLLAEIGRREDISVSQKELSDALLAKVREFPGQEQQVFDYYKNSEPALATLRAPLFEEKIVDFILKNSKVKEISVTPQELEKVLLEEEEAVSKRLSSPEKEKKTTKKQKAKE